ncbi:MAG: hypothetical protein ACRC1Z_03620, partial [Waterburya sp.]
VTVEQEVTLLPSASKPYKRLSPHTATPCFSRLLSFLSSDRYLPTLAKIWLCLRQIKKYVSL